MIILKLLFLLNIFISGILQNDERIIIDSEYTFEEAVSGIDIPQKILNDLVLIEVEYYSFDKKLHRGQLLINKNLKDDIEEIFKIIKEIKFPVEKVIPVSHYRWSDEKSMLDNNTSAFNYRTVKGTKVLSAHSTGRAIDINPKLNPQIKRNKVIPEGAKHNPEIDGTITLNSFLTKEFIKRGWQWGGTWRSTKDYQHFEKRN